MAGSARDIQMRELKDTISELNKLIKTLQQTIEAANAREAALCQERDNLKEQMDYLTKRLFGASSEKGKCDIPGQLDLFNEADGYTGAVKPLFRKTGNRQSGKWKPLIRNRVPLLSTY